MASRFFPQCKGVHGNPEAACDLHRLAAVDLPGVSGGQILLGVTGALIGGLIAVAAPPFAIAISAGGGFWLGWGVGGLSFDQLWIERGALLAAYVDRGVRQS